MLKYSALLTLLFLLFGELRSTVAQRRTDILANGVSKLTVGKPDSLSPYRFAAMQPMKAALSKLPSSRATFPVDSVQVKVNNRGTVVVLPLSADEQLYGLGMQIGAFNQRGLKVRPIVNDNPLNDLGYTHGPATFYLSNKGYGILINTARYTTFYCGTTAKLQTVTGGAQGGGNSVAELYANKGAGTGTITVDIPGAQGVEVFIFDGPDLKTAMQRYNLFSGGGALPAIWGLGIKYRVKADFNQSQVGQMAAYFRDNHIPCDVLGLEPKWQTAAYSCSYVWNTKLFSTPDKFIDTMLHKGFHLNLWEHAFVSNQSPLFEPLKNRAGDYLVWNGLVPDFGDAAARNLFADYHAKTFAAKGISGFKMDECDNSNLAMGDATWSFPELSTFPSGLSGEQMHQLFGLLYQQTIYSIYKKQNKRTYLDVRASGDFASPYPAVLYSDSYDHKQYIRMISTAGFAGMLWSPEVRESKSVNDFMRRSQTAVLSAQTLFNSWYLKNPPWLQINIEKNNHDQFMDEAKTTEAEIRKLFNFRMSLIPYLYAAFADYQAKGIPPFRALVMDYPKDSKTFNLSDEYMIGSGILAAPLTEEQNERQVYLPKGTWYDFNTNKKYQGGQTYTIKPELTQLPIFIKSGTVLPLAKPLENVSPDYKFELVCYVYGDGPASASLFEDDGYTFNYEKGSFNRIQLNWDGSKGKLIRNGQFKEHRYAVSRWQLIK
ncbi:glycoside hydrolase family 31 protein [Mucilaginibacter lacusdianchii]|uniref:glycoside hydrolase family 31 protein n=1 Tax=Mucilaginibacter lacusdianchii TaxID=2684211 RepID=UPI00131E9D01|nr:TIM-barrel domain-containing protein [Mucilaginibacter sp. JXJ CY 39]